MPKKLQPLFLNVIFDYIFTREKNVKFLGMSDQCASSENQKNVAKGRVLKINYRQKKGQT